MNSASDRGVQQRADDRRSVSARGRRLATWLAAVPLAGLMVAGCGGGGGDDVADVHDGSPVR